MSRSEKSIVSILLVLLGASAIGATESVTAAEPAPAESRRFTTVSRIELVIDRPAEAIWPYLLDLTKWAGDQKIEYLNDRWGQPGGKLRRLTFEDGRLVQDRFEEIIAVEPARRLAVRVRPAPPDPSNMDVIANMELTPIAAARTTFRLDVYIASDLPEPLDFESRQRHKQQIENDMTPALLARYRQLKAALEKK